MSLSYKNNSSDYLMKFKRNIDFANVKMIYGMNHIIDVDLTYQMNEQQLYFQADVFAREIMIHRSSFDLKRILGSYQEDWLRLLHETYIYDRIRAVYYGLNSRFMLELPSGIPSFPGNVYLCHILAKKEFSFEILDEQPYYINVHIKYNTDVNQVLSKVFETIPNLKEGISDIPNRYTYVNNTYEAILKGLKNALTYIESKKNGKEKKESLYQMSHFHDDTLLSFFSSTNNPLLNSFLSKDLTKFYFITNVSDSKPQSINFDESVFLPRGIGLTGSPLNLDGNFPYVTAIRQTNDPFTRDEVYAITGLKSNLIPYSNDQIKQYLSINTYSKIKELHNGGGSNNTTTP